MKRLISILLVLTILFSLSLGLNATLPVNSSSDEQKKLEELSREEKEILEELFTLVQGIKEMEEVEKSTSVQIKELKNKIQEKELEIVEKEISYGNNLDIMEDILRSYQQKGSTTYLELILGSDNLSTLLRRVNFLRDISRNTEKLLEELEEAKEELEEDRNKIQESLLFVEERQKELKEAITKQQFLKSDLEKKLASLQEEKSKFEEYLFMVENSWKSIKPTFTETINQFTKMIEDGNLPEETIDINIGLSGVKGIILEKSLSTIFSSQEFPTKIDMRLNKDNVELLLPEIGIRMSGSLEILKNKQTLRFNMEEGSYLDMKLEKSAMEELFSFGYLEFNFKKLLGKSTIKNIIIYEDKLELIINPVIF